MSGTHHSLFCCTLNDHSIYPTYLSPVSGSYHSICISLHLLVSDSYHTISFRPPVSGPDHTISLRLPCRVLIRLSFSSPASDSYQTISFRSPASDLYHTISFAPVPGSHHYLITAYPSARRRVLIIILYILPQPVSGLASVRAYYTYDLDVLSV